MLDPLPNVLQDKIHATSVCEETMELLLATFRINTNIKMILLIPTFIANALVYSYFTADWPKVSFSFHNQNYLQNESIYLFINCKINYMQLSLTYILFITDGNICQIQCYIKTLHFSVLCNLCHWHCMDWHNKYTTRSCAYVLLFS